MKTAIIKKVKAFVTPLYDRKDELHGVGHIERLLKAGRVLAQKHTIDQELLEVAAWIHGVVWSHEAEIMKLLRSLGISPTRAKEIIRTAWESQKDKRPASIEGRILHDAHLLEGGISFLVTKTLVVGTTRGQDLRTTLQYLQKNVLGKFKCYLPETRKSFREKERYARTFLRDTLKNLD